ncbi:MULTISPECIES: nitrogen regulation protein NR(I) [Sphingobium]|uniref:DNA-binding transcriptional regulator NtrC n=1 Tax=Sphingobium lignivorans TaxID=2735886 RepID=A0ABR6NEZ0_9SPHN|nr:MULTISPECIES: nitrogen regulation protein NR(I) [Sphingobium]MBB5985842.1 two-component system nitrogen regulation response regulator GlnG [Sphingobium lignivorans]BAK66472.1 nitrogen assimilation regulatory protein [Sphingobium sp. SYK-6]
MTRLTGKILVVDDDPAICVVISEALKRQGHIVRTVGSIAERRATLPVFAPDVLITDVMLPDGDGLDDVGAILAEEPDLKVIILSAQNTLNTAVRATGQGAFEYLPKPFDLNELSRAVAEAISVRSSGDAPEAGEGGGGEELPLIGRSPQMQEVYRTIARVVSNDLNILVLGESGTGKELVAEAIHSLGPRRSQPFVAINMAAIPRELIEAELFGYERGAFTGAVARSAGKFEQAEGGTLFLDEIGDMPMDAQTRLLRVLQSGEITTVGGTRPVRVNVRIIAATNQDLPDLIAEGRFREDLFYRLNVVPIRLPALRERAGDVPLLARYFLDKAAQGGLPRKSLSDEAARLLEAYDWPGNVRELQNLMKRLTVLTRDQEIQVQHLRQVLTFAQTLGGATASGAVDLREAARRWVREQLAVGTGAIAHDLHDRLLGVIEPVLLGETLAALDGNQIRAAATLGMNRNTLRKKLNHYDIDPAMPLRER